MSFARIVDRVRRDFLEMPGLELTMPQAVRLWNLGADDCRYVLDSLVDVGFLRWTASRTIVRTGRELRIGDAGGRAQVDSTVRQPLRRNKSVGSD